MALLPAKPGLEIFPCANSIRSKVRRFFESVEGSRLAKILVVGPRSLRLGTPIVSFPLHLALSFLRLSGRSFRGRFHLVSFTSAKFRIARIDGDIVHDRLNSTNFFRDSFGPISLSRCIDKTT